MLGQHLIKRCLVLITITLLLFTAVGRSTTTPSLDDTEVEESIALVASASSRFRKAGDHKRALETLQKYLVESRAVAITWAVDMHSGWSTLGRQIMTRVHQQGRPCIALSGVDSDVNKITKDERELRALRTCIQHASIASEWKGLAKVMGTPKKPLTMPIPVLNALGDGLDITDRHTIGSPHIGLLFAERTYFDATARQNAKLFDTLVVGSEWMRSLVVTSGLHHDVRYLPQGTNTSLFRPSAAMDFERLRGKFVVFAGGKLELRKGQDTVLVAFKQFYKTHKDSILVTAWQNQYVESAAQIHLMGKCPVAVRVHPLTRMLRVRDWIHDNGLPYDAFAAIGMVSQTELAKVQCRADASVYASRCEAGTNLFAMQSLACGTPTIISNNTGHIDILGGGGPCQKNKKNNVRGKSDCTKHAFPLVGQTAIATPQNITQGWGESREDEIVSLLEYIYDNRQQAKQVGDNAVDYMREYWDVDARVGDMVASLLP